MEIAKYIAHRRKDGQEQPLAVHLTEAGDIASNLSSKIGLPEAGRLIGLLHDFGKYSKSFQDYINSATGVINPDEDDYVDFRGMKGKIDHSTAGAQYIWQQCGKWGKHGEIVGQILSLCVASHHSGLIDCLAPDGVDVYQKRMVKGDDRTHLNECQDNVPSDLIQKAKTLIDQEFIGSFVVKLKQITKNYEEYPKSDLVKNFNIGFLTRFLFSCLVDADRINSADFECPDNRQHRSDGKPDWGQAVRRVEKFLADLEGNKPIDRIRRDISDYCKQRAVSDAGIYSLTVPTGGGKTFASLRFALHHAKHHSLDRIFYIIPYTSIIDQNAREIRKAIERETDNSPWVLEHHSNLEPEQQTWHSKLVSENWDAPIVLTTMVQFLEVLFSGGTRGARRTHQLANSVLIFDEIQTLPVNCTHLFCNAINFLSEYCNTTVVLCTATQPVLDKLRSPQKGQLSLAASSELVPDVKNLFDDLKRVELSNKVKSTGWSEEEITDLALAEFQEKGSCLIIVNTKHWAKNLYQALAPHLDKNELYHLSTNLCPQHRKVYLGRIRERLARGLPVLCISTQLIEAGVDVDFASVIRFLAGLDSIAQAAGRCNRNGLRGDSIVHVVNPQDEKIELLKDIRIGREVAQRVLAEEFNDMLSPDAMKQYFNYYFYDRADEMAYPVSKKQLGRDDTLLNMLSGNNLAGQNGHLLAQSFMTAGRLFKAIDSPTQAVIVSYNKAARELIGDLCSVAKEFDGARYRCLLRDAQRYSVNVFPNVWKKLLTADAVYEIQPGEGIYFLDEKYYSKEFGLSQEPVSTMDPAVI